MAERPDVQLTVSFSLTAEEADRLDKFAAKLTAFSRGGSFGVHTWTWDDTVGFLVRRFLPKVNIDIPGQDSSDGREHGESQT